MIIGIDASRANKQHKTGTEWYSWHLIQELKKIAQPSDKFLLYTNNKLEHDLAEMPTDSWQEKDLNWPPKYLWTQIRLWWELLVSPPDVLVVPAHTIPILPIRRKIKVAVNVHDVGFKRFPDLYKPIQVWYHDLTMRRIKARADLIITISEFSKREIIDLYGVAPEKIKVVYLGYDDSAYNESAAEKTNDAIKKYNLTQPYLLYVGRLEKKKNIGNIVAAFALAKNELSTLTKGGDGGGLKLVLAGAGGNQFEEIKTIIANLKLEREIILPGYVDQEDLPGLIAGAEIFLFPTLYEGFGLPILEAMACGTPVIASDQAPHTEVAGEAGVFVDPQSPTAMADAIIKILENPEYKESLKIKGLSRTKEFSWRKTAEDIYKIIKAL